MAYKIQLRRGNKVDLPTLDNGEVGYTQDTNELYVGAVGGNKRLTFDSDKYASYDAQLESVNSSLADIMQVNVRTQGAKGDGADYTSIIQNVIDTVPDGTTIIGDSNTYTVTGLDVRRSNIDIKKLKLKLKDGDNYWRSPIRLIGTWDNPISNINLEDITIDGNRTNQTNLRVDGSGNATESRPGIALYGVISDVTMKRIDSKFNAGDGIWASAGSPTVTDGVNQVKDDTQLCLSNIKVEDSIFVFNRRHGGSLDSIEGIDFENCIFDYNGTDINGGVTTGDKGEPFNGALYGMGFDAESMGAGHNYRDINFKNCSFRKNAGSSLALISSASDLSYEPFVQIKDITIDNCTFDGYSTGMNYSTLYITPKASNVALNRKLYDNIRVKHCTFVTGGFDIASADNVFIDDILFKDLTPTNLLNFNSCGVVIISNTPTGEGKLYSDGGGTIITPVEWTNKQTNKIYTVNAYADLAGLTKAIRGDIALLKNPTDYGIRSWVKTTNGWNIHSSVPQAVTGQPPTTTIVRYKAEYSADGSILGYIPVYSG